MARMRLLEGPLKPFDCIGIQQREGHIEIGPILGAVVFCLVEKRNFGTFVADSVLRHPGRFLEWEGYRDVTLKAPDSIGDGTEEEVEQPGLVGIFSDPQLTGLIGQRVVRPDQRFEAS